MIFLSWKPTELCSNNQAMLETGDLTLLVSEMLPSTSTDFPSTAVGLAEESGTRSNISFEPDTRSNVLPFAATTVPAMIAVDYPRHFKTASAIAQRYNPQIRVFDQSLRTGWL
jgi:hypothetical protein